MRYLFCVILSVFFAAFCEDVEHDVQIEDTPSENPITQQEEDDESLLAAEIELRDFDPNMTLFHAEDNLSQNMDLYQEEKIERNFHVLVFTQLIPGAGLGVRFGDRIQYELNVAVFTFGAKGSFILIKPFGKNNNWYTGAGVGIFSEIFSDTLNSLYVPTILGYRGGRTFADIGIDLTQMFKFTPMPNLRVGFYF